VDTTALMQFRIDFHCIARMRPEVGHAPSYRG
jgi:hypothetical protein